MCFFLDAAFLGLMVEKHLELGFLAGRGDSGAGGLDVGALAGDALYLGESLYLCIVAGEDALILGELLAGGLCLNG